jgi:hypothetical protein
MNMEMIKTLWNILVLATCLTCFGGLAGFTYKLGMSALELHQEGLVSLSKFSRSLVGNESLGR